MNARQADTAFAEGLKNFNAGDAAGAEAKFRECLALAPEHPAALLNLGVLLLRLKRLAESEQILMQLRALAPVPDAHLALAVVFENTQRLAEAEKSLADALAAAPENAGALTAAATFYERHYLHGEAAKYWRRLAAAEPRNVEAVVRYAECSWGDAPAESVAALERALADATDTATRIQILGLLTSYKEWHSRREHGLMPYHASDVSELFFRFAKAEFDELHRLTTAAADPPATLPALAQRCGSLFVAGALSEIDTLLERNASLGAGNIWGCVRFGEEFHTALARKSDAALFDTLPPVENVVPMRAGDEPAVYLSCDDGYFHAFALPMIRSLADKAPNAHLHVHIMDADAARGAAAVTACDGLPLALSLTREEIPARAKRSKGAARNYFHAIRLIRFYQHLAETLRPLWLMDVDGLFNRSPEALFARLTGHDVALRARPGRFEPWNQFNASVVGGAPTPASLRYFRQVAAYIAHFHNIDALAWGIDQLALYAVYNHLLRDTSAPRIAFLDDRAVDYDYADDGVIWCNSGGAKHRKAPDSLRAKLERAPVRDRYEERFARYATP